MDTKHRRRRKALTSADPDLSVEWNDYPIIEPGIYRAYCRAAKWYRDPNFKRWACLIKFDILHPNLIDVIATVPLWLNGGGGERPFAGRRSKYFTEWIRAHGRAPKGSDRLTPTVFVRRMLRVQIGDTKGLAKYSVVRKILEWETGSQSLQLVTKSHSQVNHQGTTAE
jgi:hypothetical protein